MYVCMHLQLEHSLKSGNVDVDEEEGGGKVKHNDLVEERISNHHHRHTHMAISFQSGVRCSTYFTRFCVGL